jgi:SAM-dependent methyltransferase
MTYTVIERTGRREETVYDSEQEASLAYVREILRAHLRGRPILVYEAGGGSVSYVGVDGLDVAATTVTDIDERQLAENTYADEKILGDLQSVELGRDRFDLVISYNVIEHIPDAEAALERMLPVVRPGGLLVIGAPVPLSINGLAARFTPHWFHVAVCKYLLGWKNAGKPGCAPFEVAYHPLVAPARLRAFAEARGFTTQYFRAYRSSLLSELMRKRPAIGALVVAGIRIGNMLSGHGTDLSQGDYHLVLRKAVER